MMEKTRNYIESGEANLPLISAACPSILRLIRVSFPELLDHIVPFLPPPEIAAQAALKLAQEKTGLPEEEIGIIYIAPCPAQVSFSVSPLGMKKTHIDACLAIKDIYPKLLPLMKKVAGKQKPLSMCRGSGLLVGTLCLEAEAISHKNHLAADGIENVIRVLNDIEDDKIPDNITFIELKGCSSGCVGGVLNVENPYIARSKILRLSCPERGDSLPFFEHFCDIDVMLPEKIEYEPVYTLGENMRDSMKKMQQVEELGKQLPGLDCGSCGAPTCHALAEDTIRGMNPLGKEKCIYLMRGRYFQMKREQKGLQKNDD
jgi:hypothetical protein